MSYDESGEYYFNGYQEGILSVVEYILDHARLDPESKARVQMAVEKFMEGERDG